MEKNLSSITLSHMQDNGYLCSDFVTTRVPRSQRPVYNAERKFEVNPNSREFHEVAAFAAVSRMWDFFLEKDPTNWSGRQVQVVLTADPMQESSGPNYVNPEFLKDTGSISRAVTLRHPTIFAPTVLRTSINKTPTLLLTNLTTDADILAHELGHHIIYEFVGIRDDFKNHAENRAIHEGLADFFVTARNEDPCLGRTVYDGTELEAPASETAKLVSQDASSDSCPADSGPLPPCEVPTRFESGCLRSGNNSLNYKSCAYRSLFCDASLSQNPNSKQPKPTGFHDMGQILTGYLWDVSRKENIPIKIISDVVFKALPFLTSREASYKDLLLSFFTADKEFYQNKYRCAFYRQAILRGFEEIIPKSGFDFSKCSMQTPSSTEAMK